MINDPTTITLRTMATWADALAVSRLRNQNASRFTNFTGTISPLRQWLWFRFVYRRLCRSGKYRVWIAEVDGQLVGYGALAERRGAHYLVATECVDSRSRRMGIGTAIVRGLLERAKPEFKFVVVDIWSDNADSISLHVRHRFKPYMREQVGDRSIVRMAHFPWE